MHKSISSLIFVCLAALALNLVHATAAFASHFRYGTITWQVVDPADPRTVTVRFDSAWRWSFFSSPPLGASINVGSLMITAPGKSVAINAVGSVTSIDNVFDYMTISQTFTFTFDATWGNNPQVYFTSCCRISSLLEGNNDRSFYVSTGITLMSPVNQPPTVATPPIIGVRFNQPNTIQLTAADPNGDPLTFRYATSAESLLSKPSPTGMTLSTSGLITFTPTLQGYYGMQVRVTDPHGAYTVADLIFYSSNAVGADPRVYIDGVAAPKTITTVHSQPITFTITGFDPEASPVTLTSGTLPPGSSMSPSLPVTAVNASSTFTWTPPPSALGTYVIPFSALDGNFRSSFQTVTLNVINSPPAIQCTVPPSIAATSQAGGVVSMSADVDDADGDPLTVKVFIDSILRSVSGLLTPPATYAFSGNVSAGPHGYQMTVSDGVSTPVQCAGTFNVADTTPPVLSLPADISLVATGPGGAVATFVASASDAIDTTPSVSCTPPSGSMFPIGVTTVSCDATDDAMNTTTGTFTVTVTQASTSLSPLTISPNRLVGSLIEVTTTLTRTSAPSNEVPGQPIRWVLTGPGPTDTLTQGSVTNTAGYAYLPFTPTQRGVYSLTAYFDGGGDLAPTQTATATFTIYQRTQLFIDVFIGTAGETIVEKAELIAQPQGERLAGRIVNFSYSGPSPVSPENLVTDASGVATAHSTFALPGTYQLTTTFTDPADFMTDAAGTIPPAPTVTTAPISISPIYTVLSDLSVVNNSSLVGTEISVSTQLGSTSAFGPALPGRPVAFTLTSPSGATTSTSTTAPFGQVSVVFPLLERGVHTLVANYAGDATTTPSSSNVVTFTVYQETALVMAPVAGIAGSPTTLAATLMLLPQNTPLANQLIQFSSSVAPGIVNGTTDAGGGASAALVFPAAGSFTVQAQFDGLADFYLSPTAPWGQPQTAFTVATISPAASNVSLTAPASALVAGPLTVSATLTRSAAPAGAVDSALVVFKLTAPSATETELWAQTDASGMASVTFTPTERGVHTVTASFSGTAALAASLSPPSSIAVYQRTLLTLAPASGGTGALPVIASLIALPQNSPLSNQNVQFSFDGVVPPQSAQTNAGGTATVMVQFPSTGTYASHASVFNAAEFLTDAAGAIPPAASTASSTVTIADATPPVITPNVTGTPGSNGWYTSDVTVSWSVSDPDTGISSSTGCAATTITTDGASFSFTCSATSGGGTSTATVSFKRDATAPTQTLPANIMVPAVNAAGAAVNYSVTRNDNLSGVASFNCAPASGSTFAVGTTTVNCSVTDAAGLTAAGSFTVTVTDAAPPVISGATPSQSSMWPPDHRMVPITISVAATDNAGAPACSIASITSNEPQNGLGDGDTPNDWLITAPLTAQLRAERAGNGNGRVYTVAIRCVDAAGNAATSSTTVSVPKSRK